ncbi:MAG: U3 snoRNP protein [Chrysothrix sp. TS-e1954]|nr:MAG: U3 snoRNP protein [Chrysothrix sp. TS-e1954]
MAPMSRGMAPKDTKIVKPRKKHTASTQSNQKHRFESFSQRIAKLKIDPIRRTKQAPGAASEATVSYFQAALEQWKDLNMSSTFTSFVSEVDPLCQSLPMIIYHRDQILDLLLCRVEQHDALSLEPLLDLIAQLAHDLGARFERCFERTLKVITQVAASHSDVAVIEWSFNCLAWLFKFLSKLLVPNLCPVYDLLAPLLGKTRQKAFVSRFAADAMSLLIRRAAAVYQKDKKPLELIIRHVLNDVKSMSSSSLAQYQQGVAAVFSEAIKGVQRGVSAGASSICSVLIETVEALYVEEDASESVATDILHATIINVIHNTDVKGFEPVLNSMLTCAAAEGSFVVQKVSFRAKLLFDIVGTRKGSRVAEWSGVLALARSFVEEVSRMDAAPQQRYVSPVMDVLAVIIQYAPISALNPHMRPLLDTISNGHFELDYLRLCILVASIGAERFTSLMLHDFQRFFTHKWSRYQERILSLLPRFAAMDTSGTKILKVPDDLQRQIKRTFESLPGKIVAHADNETTHAFQLATRYLALLSTVPCSQETLTTVTQRLLSLFDEGTMSAILEGSLAEFFAYASALGFVTRNADSDALAELCWPDVLAASKRFGSNAHYLQAVLDGLKKSNLDKADVSSLLANLTENLASPSHELRLYTLNVFSALRNSQSIPVELVELALTIEQTPPSVESLRSISMNVRRLAALYKKSVSKAGSDTKKPILLYLFGLLHIRLTPIWADACDAIGLIVDESDVEQRQFKELIFSWLAGGSSIGVTDETEAEDHPSRPSWSHFVGTEFECTNLTNLRHQVTESFRIATEAVAPDEQILHLNDSTTPQQSMINRSQGLLVLKKLPRLAEKNSRLLSPLLFTWFDDRELEVDDAETGLMIDGPLCQSQKVSKMKTGVSKKHRKALLEVLAQFVNPTVLYRSQDVYAKMLEILCSGDSELQVLALKGILTWKHSSIEPYRDNLLNLLDDARFRDELSLFCSIDADIVQIQSQHQEMLMPVLLRILYGRVLRKSGSKDAGGQEAKRKAILMSLAGFGHEGLRNFLSIALGPFERAGITQTYTNELASLASAAVSLRKQLGLLRLLVDMLHCLPNLFEPFADYIGRAVLYCLIESARVDDAEQINTEKSPELALSKSVRREGLKCLCALYTACINHDWSTFTPTIMAEVVRPRLPQLPIETAQGISAILRLFSIWSSSPNTIGMLCSNDIIAQLARCLTVPSARDEVKPFILHDILKPLIETSYRAARAPDSVTPSDRQILDLISGGVGTVLLNSFSEILEAGTGSPEILEGVLHVMARLASVTTDSGSSDALMETTLKVLSQPPRIVNFIAKGRALEVLEASLDNRDVRYLPKVWDVLAPLLSYFKDAPNRRKVVSVLKRASAQDQHKTLEICEQINAFLPHRLNEPDLDERLKAYDTILKADLASFNMAQWLPIVHNLIYYVKDSEYSIRSSASAGLRHFLSLVGSADGDSSSLISIVDGTVLAAVQHGMRESSELVRAEFVSIVADMVKHGLCGTQDMQVLLGSDEESSFFNNVLHIQKHRRSRALRVLATESVGISSVNVARFCIPLVEHTLSADDEASADIREESLKAFGALLCGLDWPRYRHHLQKLVQDTAQLATKAGVRTVTTTVDAMYRAQQQQQLYAESSKGANDTRRSNLAKTMPKAEALMKSLSQKILPSLLTYTHFKDEASVDFRVMIAVAAVKVILTFPEEQISQHIPSVLMDVCNVLRSRAQDARDLARKTLASIANLIGPAYFGFLLKQLRSALQRGYQLHVLSYTLHSILVETSKTICPGDLDYCMDDIMAIIIEDVYGAVGQEKEAQEYVSKMREVKKRTLGFDSLEIVAKIVSLHHVRKLVDPIRSQLQKPRPKVEKAEELFRRLREGLRSNPESSKQPILTLCHELLREAYKSDEVRLTSVSATKTAGFALELLRRVLDKHEGLKTAENLTGLMAMINTSARQPEDEIQIAAMRLLTAIIKVPLNALDDEAGQYLLQVRRIVEGETTTTTLRSQSALRFLAALLRERPNAVLKQSQFSNHIAFLLSRIQPDLHEPARQGDRDRQIAAFNFLKAVLGRGVLMTEVYEIMETVREVMITSSTDLVPDLARSVYSRFVVDYFPEEGKALKKQLNYLVSNLQYPQPRGRLSVMEVVLFIINRKSEQTTQPMLVEFFLPLLLVLTTDDSENCRESARVVLSKIFERADKERTTVFKNQLLKWLEPDAEPIWQRVAFLCWPIYLSINREARREAAYVAAAVRNVIQPAVEVVDAARLTSLESALSLWQYLTRDFATLSFSSDSSDTWSAIFELVASENEQIRLQCLQLISQYTADLARGSAKDSLSCEIPLRGSGGLTFDEQDARAMLESHIRLLKTTSNDRVVDQVTRNLAFLGRVTCNESTISLFQHLIAELCAVIRLESADHSAMTRLAALTLLSTICHSAPTPLLQKSLKPILLTLSNLTDTAITSASATDPHDQDLLTSLNNTAQELQHALQAKFGTVDFVGEMQQVQRQVKRRRDERRAKRQIEAVSAPERAERVKVRKHENTKVRRKEKNRKAAGMRKGW